MILPTPLHPTPPQKKGLLQIARPIVADPWLRNSINAICAQRMTWYSLKRLRDQALKLTSLILCSSHSLLTGLDMLYLPGVALLLLSCVGQSMLFPESLNQIRRL